VSLQAISLVVNVPWINLIVVDHFPVGVRYRGTNLQALKLIGWLGSATTRRRVLGGGFLSESAGSCPLGNLLGMSGGSPARARGSDCLTMLGAALMSFVSHGLQKDASEEGEITRRMLGTRCENLTKKPWIVDIRTSKIVLKDRICPALGPNMSGHVRSGQSH
jgi:hypothetical protein